MPSIGNEFVVNIKDSSVLNVIAVSELFFMSKSAIAGVLAFVILRPLPSRRSFTSFSPLPSPAFCG